MNTIDKLKQLGLVNEQNKVSPWLERKITTEMRLQIIAETSFLDYDEKLSNRVVIMILKLTEQPRCAICGSNIKFEPGKKVFGQSCSVPCGAKLSRAKVEQTMLNRYGVKSSFQLGSAEELSARGRAGAHAQKAKLATMGYSNVMDILEVKVKHKASLQNLPPRKYLDTHHSRKHFTSDQIDVLTKPHEAYAEHLSGKSVYAVAKEHGFHTSVLHSAFAKHNLEVKRHAVTEPHLKITNFIKSLDIDVKINDRVAIKPFELDCYMPSYKLAVEINGLYWHSREETAKHIDKLRLCNENGIRLIQFTDKQINENFEVCASILGHALGKSSKIFARKLKVVEIDSSTFRTFCEENHIEGSTNSSVRLALVDEANKIYSVMGFAKDRFGSCDWELTRFCTVLGYTVVGGASKLFAKRPIGTILSYSYADYYHGTVYESLGFKYGGNTAPNYFWTNRKGDTLSRYQTQKHKLSSLLGMSYNPGLTEEANMKANGWNKYIGCGSKRWIFTCI